MIQLKGKFHLIRLLKISKALDIKASTKIMDQSVKFQTQANLKMYNATIRASPLKGDDFGITHLSPEVWLC